MILRAIRRYSAHTILGLAVGAASYELWQHLLNGVPLWWMCAIAAVFGVAVDIAALAVLRERRTRRARPRRRAHARTAPNTRKAT